MIHNFSDIYNNYDLFFIDVWGVVHDGYIPYQGTVKMLNKLLEEKNLFFVSNAPRPNYVVSAKLKEYGIKLEDNHVVTSGDVTRAHLKRLALEGKSIFHLGEARNKDILKDIDITVATELNKADYLLLTPYLDHGEDLNQFDNIFKEAVRHDIPALCANPDTNVINGDSTRYCAGFFAEKIKELGGNVEYFGKPHRNIYDFALKQLSSPIPLSKILMIGDTIDTDILGANQAGVHSALVLTGNSEKNITASTLTTDEAKLARLAELFDVYQATPTWIIKGLF
jgi:HAD superfamily hydrolase (TIGR01459 family)